MNSGIFIIEPMSFKKKIIDISKFIELEKYEFGWRYHKRIDYKQYCFIWFGKDTGETGLLICQKFTKSPMDILDGLVIFRGAYL